MADVSRGQLAAYLALALAILVVGVRYLQGGAAPGDSGDARPVPVQVADQAPEDSWLIVQVAGEVRRPGVFRMRAGERAADAVSCAGGATEKADLAAVNLAAKVEDGRQVIVPRRGTAPAAAAAGGGAAGGGDAPLNLNTATADQLDELDGIGPATAEKIIAYRDEHGGFGSVEELDRVDGIGPKRLAALKERLRV